MNSSYLGVVVKNISEIWSNFILSTMPPKKLYNMFHFLHFRSTLNSFWFPAFGCILMAIPPILVPFVPINLCLMHLLVQKKFGCILIFLFKVYFQRVLSNKTAAGVKLISYVASFGYSASWQSF